MGIVATAVRVWSAELPAPLVSALEQMAAEKSYSWEVISTAPPSAPQEIRTRRGTVQTVPSISPPHINASLSTSGDLLLKREWADGVKLDTLVTADGQFVTHTPEGWMTQQEILTAMAEERNNSDTPSARYQWLRRADRPDTRKPYEELMSVLRSAQDFEVNGTSYIARLSVAAENSQTKADVTVTINLRGGVVRDYQVAVEGAQSIARLGVKLPFSMDNYVIMTYLAVRKLDVPQEAWDKVKGPASKRP